MASMGGCRLLEIRRNVYYGHVGILSQENEVLTGLGMRERNHLQFCLPICFLLMVTTEFPWGSEDCSAI